MVGFGYGEACGTGDGQGGGFGYPDIIQQPEGIGDGSGLHWSGGGYGLEPGGYGSGYGAGGDGVGLEWKDLIPRAYWYAKSRYEYLTSNILPSLRIISVERSLLEAIAKELDDAEL